MKNDKNNFNDIAINQCTINDFNEIIRDIADFWGSDRALRHHHPYLLHEF